jgi:hypothetical protein
MAKSNFPAITDPRGTAKDVLLAVQNIRARIEALEAVTATPTQATGITVTPTSATLQAAIVALQSKLTTLTATVAALSASASSTSQTTNYTCIGAVAAPQAVYETSSGEIAVADSTVLAKSYSVLGVAQSSGGSGSSIKVATAGSIAQTPGITLSPGYPVFCGANGLLTQTPVAGSVALQVGIAISSSTLFVQPDQQLTTYEVNGVSVGWRRQVDFVQGTGIILTAVDDPTNNRVVIVISQGSSGGNGCYPH